MRRKKESRDEKLSSKKKKSRSKEKKMMRMMMKNRKVESYFTIALPSFSQICINSRFLCIKSNTFLCFLLLFLASLFLLVILIKRRIGNGFSTLIKLVVYEVAMHIGLQHVAANEVFQSQFSKFFTSDLGIMKNIKILKN